VTLPVTVFTTVLGRKVGHPQAVFYGEVVAGEHASCLGGQPNADHPVGHADAASTGDID